MSKQTKIALSSIAIIILLIGVALFIFLPPQEQPRPTSRTIATTPTQITLANAIPTNPPTSTPPPAKASPTSTIYPSPTRTPVARTLAEFVDRSRGIAEITVTNTFTGSAVVRVERWIKAMVIPTDDDNAFPPYTINQPYLDLYFSSKIPSPVVSGKRYLIFLDVGHMDFPCHPHGYSILEDSTGVYEINNGLIAQAGLPTYNGMSVASFGTLIEQHLSDLSQIQPTVMPDMGQEDLTNIVKTADVILDVRGLEGDAGGRSYEIKRVLKKPAGAGVPEAQIGGTINLPYYLCGAPPQGAGRGGYYIVFVHRRTEPGKVGWEYETNSLGFFAINSKERVMEGHFTYTHTYTEEVWTDDSLNHYAGWSLADLETAIADAINTPYIPSTPVLPYP